MSATSTPTDSPVSMQPLHNPSQAAHVVVPQAPLGNATNGATTQAPGLGMQALLKKKMASQHNPKFISPTDNLMTPCTKKLNAAKQKHFQKGAKSMGGSLFAQEESASSQDDDDSMAELTEESKTEEDSKMVTDEENPF